jgi:hypothetical protein
MKQIGLILKINEENIFLSIDIIYLAIFKKIRLRKQDLNIQSQLYYKYLINALINAFAF